MREEHFETPQPIRLEVKVASGTVEVATVPGADTSVTLDGPEAVLDATRVELIGDRLVIEERRKSLLGFLQHIDHSLDVRVRLPHGSSADIASASSNAMLDGRYEMVRARSASGDLALTGEVAGDARAETASGDVRLARVNGDLRVNTVSGDTRADVVGGSVSVNSVSGGIHIGSLREGTANARSVSGDVELGIAVGTSVDVDATSASGEVTSDIPLSQVPGGEGGPTVVIRGATVSGHFRVFRASESVTA